MITQKSTEGESRGGLRQFFSEITTDLSRQPGGLLGDGCNTGSEDWFLSVTLKKGALLAGIVDPMSGVEHRQKSRTMVLPGGGILQGKMEADVGTEDLREKANKEGPLGDNERQGRAQAQGHAVGEGGSLAGNARANLETWGTGCRKNIEMTRGIKKKTARSTSANNSSRL